MPVSEPSWWYGPGGGWQTALLSPIGAIVGAIASRRLQNAKPYRSPLTVICVGNFTAGGSGKTPLALLLAKLVAEENREPWFLSRGYGGRLQGPVCVNPARHSASDVGDEPLLLARTAPTVIARNRREGAETIEALASKNAVIIMDDGLQNPVLAKDLSIAVVDARRGFGNGHVIPAGPLRAPLAVQMNLADLIVLTGQGSSADVSIVRKLRALTTAPIVSAQTRAEDSAAKFRRAKGDRLCRHRESGPLFFDAWSARRGNCRATGFCGPSRFQRSGSPRSDRNRGTDGRGSRDDGERSCETIRHDRRLRDTQGALGSARDQNGYRR